MFLMAAVLLVGFMARPVAAAPEEGLRSPARSPRTVSDWHGYKKQSFELAGHPCFVVEPKIAAPGMPWVWRMSFPDFHAEIDLELLKSGWHVGFVDCVDWLGADPALDLMDRFYEKVRSDWGLSARPGLEAVSRGGLHAYRYAARRPERVACLYADTPVMDLKSWPRKWPGAQKEWQEALRVYGFADEVAALAYAGNPVDMLSVIAQAKIPLRHVISLTDRVVPPEENTLAAQRRLEALGHTMELVLVPAGTPESSGHHFPLPEIFASARFIVRHTYVLPQKAEYFALRSGLGNARAKFAREKNGRIAFLGGSITYNGGWRDAVMDYFQQRFPDTKFEFIAAGIPSLGSVPHAFRLERDVLSHGLVDVLFVEAAVNDTTNEPDPNRMRRGMEGVIRHVRTVSPTTDIVQMHFVMPEHMADYGQGRAPSSVQEHEKVAEYYGCMSLNLAKEVTDRIAAKEFSWAGDFRDLHPSPYGQVVYANSITHMLDQAFTETNGPPRPHRLPAESLDPCSYSRGRFGNLADLRILKGFERVAAWKPEDGKGTRDGFVNVPALVATEAGAEFEFTFEGTGAGLFITAGPDAGLVEFRTDHGPWKRVDTFTPWSSGLHLPWALLLDDQLPVGRHTTQVRIASDRNAASVGTALRIMHVLLN